MEKEKVFGYIDELYPEYLQFWADICETESPTTYKAGVDAVGALCAACAAKYGWQVITHKEAVSGDALCIVMNPDAPGKSICLSGHMDTVHPVGSFGKPAVRIEDGKIYGPGVADCKGGIAAAFLAMAALQKAGFADRPVKLILQSDEENGSATSDKRTVGFMADMASGCAAFLNTEPHTPNKLLLTRKGICKFRFDITGKAFHAGACYQGVSAIAEAAKIILELEKYKDKDGITFSCGLITGGTAINTVPEFCTFHVDSRFATQQQRDEILRIVHSFEENTFHPEATCKVSMASYRCAMEVSDQSLALLERMNEIFRQTGLPEQERSGSNGGSDAADMNGFGIAAIDGFGTNGRKFHNRGEESDIASLTEAAQRMAAIIMYL